jgi:hypothetical protein
VADADCIAFGTYAGVTSQITEIYVYNNVVYECANAGIHFANRMGVDSRMYDNLCYDSGTYNGAKGCYRMPKHGGQITNNTVYNVQYGSGILVTNDIVGGSSGVMVANNIIEYVNEVGEYGINCSSTGNCAGSGDNNIVYVNPGSAAAANKFSTDYYETGDPLMDDPANDDYTLQPTSPAINAGDNTYAYRAICAGTVDIGYWESCPRSTLSGSRVR